MKTIYFATKAVIVHEGRFLAMRRAGGKDASLELPGGRMEYGETAEQTVIREVLEETNLHITPIRLLDTWNFIPKDYGIDADYQITGVIFLCAVESIDDFIMSDEHDLYEWLPADRKSAEKMQVLFRPQMEKWDWDELLTRI
ncbi:MAG: NUDIX domain-containing protein [Defluviitaleaceae bacterium]|nr:NUDIX domain-containing protein [Defluviitaleaceae bacterium]